MVGSDFLAGHSAFVAGGTSGINLGIAKALSAAGAKVAVISRKPDKVEAAVAAIGSDASGDAVDVRDYDAVAAAVAAAAARNGPLSIIVSGAAGNFIAPAAGLSSNGFRTVIEIDLIGTFNVLRAAYCVARKPGALMVNISAPQSTSPYFGQSHVCSAKAGVDMLTKCLALEWGPEGIRVNGIVPGPIDGTEGMARLAPTPQMRKIAEEATALRRFGEIDDIAAAVLFMASAEAGFITGAILNVDGGQTLAGNSSFLPHKIFG